MAAGQSGSKKSIAGLQTDPGSPLGETEGVKNAWGGRRERRRSGTVAEDWTGNRVVIKLRAGCSSSAEVY